MSLVSEITIGVPYSGEEKPDGWYYQQVIAVKGLTDRQAEALYRIKQALKEGEETCRKRSVLHDNVRVTRESEAIRWVLDRVADEIGLSNS